MPPLIIVRRRFQGVSGGRLVISIGKGVARKAVTRNLLKRRIRAVMRPILKEKEGYFSVIARPGAAEATFADIKREILESIK